MNTLQISSTIVTIFLSVSAATDSSFRGNNTRSVLQVNASPCSTNGSLQVRRHCALDYPPAESESQPINSVFRWGPRASTRARAPRAHLKTSQLMGLNLINCSETDTLSLINPFLRHCAHGKSGDNTTQAHTETHKHTHICGDGGTERLREGEREGLGYVHTHGKTWSFARVIQL